jgi:hypothetical protein
VVLVLTVEVGLLYTHSNSKCLKTLFAGMGICLSLRGGGLCSAKDIPVAGQSLSVRSWSCAGTSGEVIVR